MCSYDQLSSRRVGRTDVAGAGETVDRVQTNGENKFGWFVNGQGTKGLQWTPMFPYDPALAAVVQAPPQSLADVLQTMQAIEATCVDGDGLKWFNWLYQQVTAAVEAGVDGGGFGDPAWLAELDVQFGNLRVD